MQENTPFSIHQPHDKGYKYLLSSKQIFVQLLRSFVDQGWVSKVDESKLVAIDKSYVLPDFSEKEADLVYRLELQEQDIILYILMELQSTVDFQMPYRLLLYQTEIWRDVLKNTSKEIASRKGFYLPAIIPIVIYNGEAAWTANQSFRKTVHGDELFGKSIVDFEYILLDVQRYRESDLLKLSNVIGAAFLLEQKADMDLLNQRLRSLVGAMEQMTEPQLQTFLTWLMHKLARKLPLQVEDEVAFILSEIKQKGVEKVISNLDKTLDEIESNALRQGIEQGMTQGKADVVKAMLEKGFDIALICELSGWQPEAVAKIKGKLN
ncbi:Rpn family recombination-promoting nuclease/putative transposase [Paenibacillus radicis (ex Xue et al. 2023)]|uniref:Rpn family recombination-promoting nuclease/putative transposase n=1 Tax=Paenibacillus radicis (ex Xue et al. 2023) TaxID=2972489 RepID=A0ABT1Y9I6_9BACL|nr:Rpn family recombination-promoting nuclease/putative transposase [Paenibacillus radicis (ex Xue et al. 2023)]MCR8629577.1 Rpn family recombination-promoting nuclease/putative transposase [Paenibacillus radicis (ex Xue et al. 2023)]